MKYFVIASHGELSKSILESVQMIMGSVDNVTQISMDAETNINDIRNQLREIIEREQRATSFIILTDVLGGSIANVSTEFISQSNVHVVTGFNLPMVIEMLNLQEKMSCKELIDYGIKQGKEGITYVNQLMEQISEVEES